MLTHRPLEQFDLETICSFAKTPDELYFFCPKADYPLTPEQLTTILEPRSHNTVVEVNSQLAGFANFYYWQEYGVCKIGNLVVNPKLRNTGVAQYLMQIMQEKALQHYKAADIQISCFNHNTAGLLLYNKLGFTPSEIEQRLDKQDNKVALIHLRKHY